LPVTEIIYCGYPFQVDGAKSRNANALMLNKVAVKNSDHTAI